MNKLALVIPGLLGPLPELEADNVTPECSVLQKWLACGKLKTATADNYYDLLAELFGLNHDFSIASVTSLIDTAECNRDFSFRADPVHFKADIDHAIMLDHNRLDIKAEEAAALIESFNQHFSADGIQLYMGHEHRWYLSAADGLDVQTTALQDAVGRNVQHFLPVGEHALNWKRFLNETQMLFYSHEVNQQRQETGVMTINSLWLWGEGQELNVTGEPSWDWVVSDDIVAEGIAQSTGVKHISLTALNNNIELPEGNGVMVLSSLLGPLSYGDTHAWSESIQQLCQQWLTAIHGLLKSRKITLLDLYPADGRVYQLSAAQLLKFWRRKKPVASYVSIS